MLTYGTTFSEVMQYHTMSMLQGLPSKLTGPQLGKKSSFTEAKCKLLFSQKQILSAGVKWLGHEADHSHPSST